MPRKKPALPAGLAALDAIEPFNMDQKHLGNLAAVTATLMRLLDADREHVVAFAAGMPWEQANAKTLARIQALAATLLGQDPDWARVEGWNKPGAIDAHLRAHLGLEGPAEKVVADALAQVVLTGRALMQEEKDADVVAIVLRHTVTKTARLLVGLRPEAAA